MESIKYGRLIILKTLDNKNVECLCDCGKKVNVTLSSLKSGNTKSCGCIKLERITKHGMCKHPLYNTWKAMKDRCTNPNSRDYPYYGGRGINMDKAWLDVKTYIRDVEAHLGKKPKNFSIDRIDNNKGYYIDNIQYSDTSQQNINKRYSSNKLGKEYKHIYERNDNGYIYYEIKIRRQRVIRMAATKDLNIAIKIRDNWLDEYNKDSNLWLTRTKNKEYKKDVNIWKETL